MKTIEPDIAAQTGTETGGFLPTHAILPDEAALWRLYQQRSGGAAENALVEHYQPLVNSILTRLAGTLPNEVDREDLHSAGLIGLLGALRKYDPATGVPFDSYARQRIRGAMLDEMRRMDWVPRDIRVKSRAFQQATQALEQELGRTPTRTEAARAMNLSLTDYDQLVEKIRPAQFLRLDAACDNDPDNETSLGELIAEPNPVDPSEMTAQAELKEILFLKLKQMPEMQRKVLSLYYLEDLTLREIAIALGVTEGRISQIHSQGLQTLRVQVQRHEKGFASQPATPAPARRSRKSTRNTSPVSGQDSLTDSLAKNRLPVASNAALHLTPA
jgi:RNA polymerase sigma factor for flagellar operon FliA